MPRRALINRRPWLLGSIAAALAYVALQAGAAPGLYLLWIKAAATGALAVYAARRHPGKAGTHLTFVLGLATAGEVLRDIDMGLGGLVLFAAWLVAMALFMRFPRTSLLVPSQKAAVVGLLLLTPLIAWLWAGHGGAAYSGLVVGAMAAAAWASRFPRYRTGVGAVIIAAHEVLGLGPMPPELDPVDWPLFYIGLLLVTIGVVQRLRRDHLA